MKNKIYHTALLFATGVTLFGCASPKPKEKTPPNILFFLVDDMGWMDAGYQGSSFYETPHIDELASQGVKFTNAYASHPRCVPSRYSLITGKYPARAQMPGPGEGKLKAHGNAPLRPG